KSKEMEEVLPPALWARNHILPNGVDLDMFAPRPKNAARQELGWGADEQVILFIGDPDDPRKNVRLAREAAETVCRENPATRLHLAWGVSPNRVPVLMNAADCLVFPSKSEGSPNVIKEAMACALPIVSTPVGDVVERLSGVENCHICEPSPQLFAAALSQALPRGRGAGGPGRAGGRGDPPHRGAVPTAVRRGPATGSPRRPRAGGPGRRGEPRNGRGGGSAG